MLGCVFALVLSGSLGASARLETISFSKPAMRVEVLLTQLSELTGEPVRASATTKDEVVLVSVKDVPVKVLLERIAEVTEAVWKEEKGFLYLVRPAEVDRKAEQASLAKRVEAVKKFISALEKTSALDQIADARYYQQFFKARKTLHERSESGGDAWTQMVRHETGLPYGRAIARLLAGVDPVEIAKLESSERVVFTQRPNRLQRPLGKNSGDVIRLLVEEQRAGVEGVNSVPGGLSHPTRTYGANIWHTEPMIESPVTVLLIVQRVQDLFSAQLKVADRDGNFIYGGALDSYAIVEEDSKNPPNLPAVPADTQVDQSENSRLLFDFVRKRVPGHSVTPDQALRSLVCKPVDHDPLSLAASDILLALATSSSSNVVCSVPEDAFGTTFYTRLQKPELMLREALRSIAFTTQFETRDDWILGRPEEPYKNRRRRIPRKTLQEFLQSVERRGYHDLRTNIKLISDLDLPPTEGSVFSIYHSIIGANAPVTIPLDGSLVSLMRFLHSVDPEGNLFKTGGSTRVGNLSTQSKKLLEQALLDGQLILSLSSGSGRMLSMNTLRSEPTISLASGLPADATVDLRITKQEGGYIPTDIRKLSYRFLEVRQVAAMAWAKTNPTVTGDQGQPNPDSLLYGVRSRITVEVRLAPDLYYEKSLEDHDFNPRAAPVPWEQMPASFVKQVEEALAKIKPPQPAFSWSL